MGRNIFIVQGRLIVRDSMREGNPFRKEQKWFDIFAPSNPASGETFFYYFPCDSNPPLIESEKGLPPSLAVQLEPSGFAVEHGRLG